MADYILNKATMVVHDTKRMSEICNVDDIENKRELTIEEFISYAWDRVEPCKHCWPT